MYVSAGVCVSVYCIRVHVYVCINVYVCITDCVRYYILYQLAIFANKCSNFGYYIHLDNC